MEKQIAAAVLSTLIEASSKLAATIEELRGQAPDEEFKHYVSAVGQILGSIQLDLMVPILREHPELDPDRQ